MKSATPMTCAASKFMLKYLSSLVSRTFMNINRSFYTMCFLTSHHFLARLLSSLHSFLKSPFHLLDVLSTSSSDLGNQGSHDGAFTTSDDAVVVLKRLGMWGIEDENYQGTPGFVRQHVIWILEEKEAGLGELREAFRVFDRNGDGYVTPMEVRGVMRRLGMREGFGLEECRRMVDAFDEDGDGRICFSEFKKMMEKAT